jgi:hypothetical protein
VGGRDDDDPTPDGGGYAKKPPTTFQTETPAEKTKHQCRTVDIKPFIVVAKAGEESKIPVKSPPLTVETVKQPPENLARSTSVPLARRRPSLQKFPNPSIPSLRSQMMLTHQKFSPKRAHS